MLARRFSRGCHPELPPFIPAEKDLVWPIYKGLYELGGTATVTDIDSQVAKDENIPSDILGKDFMDGYPRSVFKNRTSWGRSILKKYGLITNISKGVWTIKKCKIQITEKVIIDLLNGNISVEDILDKE